MPTIQETLVRLLTEAAEAAAPDLGLDPADVPEPELSRPRQKEHGDWASNIALVLAKAAGRSPREVASAIVANLPIDDAQVRSAEVAGPGFINLRLGPGWLHDILADVLTRGNAFGFKEQSRSERVQVEFVSANPTGPLHVGTARNAAIGDSLADVLEAAGWDVEREYYFNDAGRQMELFGASVEARYLQHLGVDAAMPADGYQGQSIGEVADRIAVARGTELLDLPPDARRAAILKEAVELTLAGIRETLERFRIRFDTWFSESALHHGAIDEAVQRLRDKGLAYDADGAVFFKSTAYGDDKDRVLIRSNGIPTYFGADCAYLLDKFGRGFDRVIYVWGADHHGDMARMHGAAEALGIDPQRITILLYQLVSLYRGGEPVRMSKRTGDVVTLDELIDEVGTDAARYTLLTRSPDSPLDFDIEAVTRQTMDNPVYYVQYAHARTASLRRVAERQGIALQAWKREQFDALSEEAELDLLRKLGEFPEMVELAADTLAPHRLTRYVEQLAAAFHRFYTECRVITDDDALTQARLWLSEATHQVIASALGLLGVSAPESMQRLDTAAETETNDADAV